MGELCSIIIIVIIDPKGPRYDNIHMYVRVTDHALVFSFFGLTDCIGVSQSGSTAAFLHLMYATKYTGYK